MAIQWNTVTRTSQLVAIIVGLLILGFGFYLGQMYATLHVPTPIQAGPLPVELDGKISDVSYQCDNGGSLLAVFYADKVTLQLSDGRTYNLPHVLSGSGARYASEDESYVFWEKGMSAMFTEPTEDGTSTTVTCNQAPIPE